MAAYQQFLRVRALASHVVPSGNAAQVIEYALKLAAELLERKKFGAGARTQLAASSSNPRYVPAAVRQAVCQRDGGRCTFVGPDGTRCNSEWHLQFDHEAPVAMGGSTTVDNLRLLCAKHNRLEAKRKLGADRVAARIEQAKAEAARRRMRKCKQAQPAVKQPEASSNGSNTAATDIGTPSVGVATGQVTSLVSRQGHG